VYTGDQVGEDNYYHGDAEQPAYADEHAEFDEFGDPIVADFDDPEFEEADSYIDQPGRRQVESEVNKGPSKLKAGLMVGGIMTGLVASGIFGAMALGIIGGNSQPTGAYPQQATEQPAAPQATPEEVSGVEQAMREDEQRASQPEQRADTTQYPVEQPVTADTDYPTRVEESEPQIDMSAVLTEDEVQTMIAQAIASQQEDQPRAGVSEEVQSIIASLQETVSAQNDTLAAYREEIVSINRRLAEKGEGESGSDLADRLAKVEKSMQTALANSRIALRNSRESQSSAPSTANNTSSSANKSSGNSTAGWEVSGMGGNRAMIASPTGDTYIVSPGDKVPGLGRVTNIETQSGVVVTQAGRIGG